MIPPEYDFPAASTLEPPTAGQTALPETVSFQEIRRNVRIGTGMILSSSIARAEGMRPDAGPIWAEGPFCVKSWLRRASRRRPAHLSRGSMRSGGKKETDMAELSAIKEHMDIIGADGVHIGTVDKVEGDRIKMVKADSGSHGDHHHFIAGGLVAAVEGNQVRLSASGSAAVLLEEEEGGEAIMDDGN